MNDSKVNTVQEEGRKQAWWQNKYVNIGVGILAVLIVVLVIRFGGQVKDFQKLGYLGVFLMGFIGSASPVWPMPGSWAAFIAGGLGWNPIFIALAAGIGEPIGETIYYILGFGGQPVMSRWEKYKWYKWFEGWMKRHGALTLFLVSAIPNNITKLADASAGAFRFPLWKFFLICWSGKTIKSLGFAIAGIWGLPYITELFHRIF